MANVLVVLPVIPENLSLGAGPPLEHAALLPAPGAAAIQLNPAVGVLQIDHADPDDIVRFRAAMLEINLHRQHIPAGGVELELVVVAKPVESWAACNRPHSRQVPGG